MKKVLVVALVVVFGAALTTAAVAAWTRGPDTPADVNAYKAFQKETLPLRDEIAAKRLELRNEYTKDNPDQAKIAALQKEMIDLRTKVSDAAKKNGLSDWGYGPGYGRGYHMGWGGGYGPGYGRGYCPMWQ